MRHAAYNASMSASTKPRAAKRPAVSPISNQLRQAIEDSGLSAYRLAADSGVNVAAILRFKAAERGLTLDSVDRIAAALGLELRSTK
jgi:hypothetical protein